jgi:hypothetical protein
MSPFFENIKIENFKSLRNVELKDCSRINLFIGKPNVGKSNILEALGLFTDEGHSLKRLVRHHEKHELFFNGKTDKTISIKADFWQRNFYYNMIQGFCSDEVFDIPDDFDDDFFDNPRGDIHVIQYTFGLYYPCLDFIDKMPDYLAPTGRNLFQILQNNPTILAECQSLFKTYNLDLLLEELNNGVQIQIRHIGKDSYGIRIPYESISKTLQRVLFYKVAILSNNQTILLFDEPETHCFPPSMVHITQEIIHSKTNQFFITTHSQFVLNDFLENAREDLAVYLVDWQDNETIVKRLSDADLYQIYQYGVDLFFNIETFI